ncbi:FAD-dependent monooxygenase [Streptomyces sp. NPDC057555]|uniref:FAD-dependent monooxygenase n=1 Tax=Streptomyces sp. NPDC057555 TaxID=3346166 RepID=UPI0036AB8F60
MPPATTSADVLVVGGGPAGLALSLLLLKSGATVALMEKSRSLEREYRGEILQPGGQAVLDRLGVLRGARDRGAYPHDGFQLVAGERVLLDSDYRRLPGPYNCLLSLPQAHLLAELLTACTAYPGFHHLPGTRLSSLLTEDGRVRGARGTGPDGAQEVRAQVVAGADGRHSKVRSLAGIGSVRQESFDQDVLWFKLPAPDPPPAGSRQSVQVYRGSGAPVLVYRSYPDSVQVGWTLPHGGYREVAALGIAHIRDRIAAAVPQHAAAVHDTLRGPGDLTLLDVFASQAERWAVDGLVLLGDSAHTHGPIGAQGINLALQDAVLLHPVLMDSLRTGDATAAFLSRFERARRPAIASVLRLQAMQGKAMLSGNSLASAVRPVVARAVARTPLYHRILHKLAYGAMPVPVRDDLFTAPSPRPSEGPRPCA